MVPQSAEVQTELVVVGRQVGVRDDGSGEEGEVMRGSREGVEMDETHWRREWTTRRSSKSKLPQIGVLTQCRR
jgi:hypothetical protein